MSDILSNIKDGDHHRHIITRFQEWLVRQKALCLCFCLPEKWLSKHMYQLVFVTAGKHSGKILVGLQAENYTREVGRPACSGPGRAVPSSPWVRGDGVCSHRSSGPGKSG